MRLITRRKAVCGIGGFIAAPAIIRPSIARPMHGGKTTEFLNFTGSNLNKYAAAVAAARNAIVLCTGDSTTAPFVVTYPQTYPTQLAALLSGGSSRSRWTNNNSTDFDLQANDTRISLGAGWAASAQMVLGGQALQCDSPNTGALAIAPGGSWDTAKTRFIQESGDGTVTTDIGGSVLTTTNLNGSSAVVEITTSVALGVHTLNIKRSTGGSVKWIDTIFTNSASKEITFLNAGNSGRKAGDFIATANPWDPGSLIASLAPDLTIIMIGVNDQINGTSLSTFLAQVQTQIVNAQTSGDVVLMSTVPSQSSQVAVATQKAFRDGLRSLAFITSCGFIDVFSLFGEEWVFAFNSGWMTDSLHPSSAGLVRIAGFLKTVLAPGFVSV